MVAWRLIAGRLGWAIFHACEEHVQSVITARILAYHDRLVADGFIPDLRPPYPGRSMAADASSRDRPLHAASLPVTTPHER